MKNHRSNNNKQQQTYKTQHGLSRVSSEQHRDRCFLESACHELSNPMSACWSTIVQIWLLIWGQGGEVTFVTVPGMDER
ncbi:hypothetical protein QQF64_009382 [Cirrhinus molitorella]|uniref:Uncharacterized protein n=1 Tax=Cirrhinus molitorella TaxID=172907 RepID=A0ABR3M2K0_9TELE